MALNDKNIVITPNKGSASDPKIDFTGASASGSGTITLNVLPANSGTLSFSGYQGTIFQIANTLTGVVTVASRVASTSTTTGALVVQGGLGVGGDLNVNGTITANQLTIQYTTITSVSTVIDDVTRITNNTQSINTQTGALVVTGGVGIGQDLYVGGVIHGSLAGGSGASIVNDPSSSVTRYLGFVQTSTGGLSNLYVDAPNGFGVIPFLNTMLIGSNNAPANPSVNFGLTGSANAFADAGIAFANYAGGGGAITSYGGAGFQFNIFTGQIGSEVSTAALIIDANKNFFVDTNGAALNTYFATPKMAVGGHIQAGSATSVNGSIILQGNTGGRGSYTNLGTEKVTGGPVLSYAVTPGNTQTVFLSSINNSVARSALVLSDSLRFYTGTTQTVTPGSPVSMGEAFRVTNQGKLGLNTGNPVSRLHVFDDSIAAISIENQSGGSTGTVGINYRFDGVDVWQQYLDNANGNLWKIRYNNTSDYLSLDTSGNLVVGNGSASSKLQVNFNDAGSNVVNLVGDGTAGAALANTWASGNAYLDLRVGGLANNSTKVRIQNNGQVSLGTLTPTSGFLLDVYGSMITSGGSITIGSGGSFSTGTIYSDSNYGMSFKSRQNTPAVASFIFWSSTGTSYMRVDPAARLGLYDAVPANYWSNSLVVKTYTTATTATGITILTTNANTGSAAVISFGYGTGVTQGSASNRGKIWYEPGSDSMNFSVGGSLLSAPNVTITTQGNLNVGNSSMTGTKLAVSYASDTVGSLTIGLANGSTQYYGLRLNTSNDLAFDRYTGSTWLESLRLDASGNAILNTGYISAPGHANASGANSALQIMMPSTASTATTTASVSGMIKIRLPVGYSDSMIRMTVKIYTYDNKSFDISLGGYIYSGGPSWLNTFAYMNTSNRTSVPVRFGYDGSNATIFIGDTFSTWSYPQVFVTDFQAGYSNSNLANWGANWNVNYISTASFVGFNVTSTATAYPAWTTGTLVNVSQLNNDAGYIGTAALTRNFLPKYNGQTLVDSPLWDEGAGFLRYNGQHMALRNGNTYTTSTWTRGLSSIIQASSSDSTGTTNAYGSRLSQNLYADGYSLNFDVLNNGSWTNDVLSVSGRSASLGYIGAGTVSPGYKLHVQGDSYSSGIVYAGASARAPIFYDQDNTAYLVDPNGTSVLSQIKIDSQTPIILTGGANTGTYNQTVIFANQNNTSGSNANGIFIERGRLTDSASAEIRNFTIGSRGGQWQFNINNVGTATALSSMSAPIYYDSDSFPNYYGDFASTSRMNLLDVNGISNIRNTQMITSAGGYSPSNAVMRMNPNLHLNAYDGNAVIVNWDNNTTGATKTFRVGNGLASDAFYVQADGTVYLRSIVDLDNTSFGVDPTGTTNLSTVTSRSLQSSNTRVDTSRVWPVGHYSSGDQVWAIDPTWSQTQLQNYFNSSNVTWVSDSTAPGGYAISIVGNVNVGDGPYGSGFPYIPIENDDIFYMEVWIRNVSGTNTHYMGSIDYDESFGNLGGNPGSYGYWVMSNNNPGVSWTKYYGYITGFSASATGTFKTGAKYWTPQALFNYTGGGTSYISGWKATRVQYRGKRSVGVFPQSTTNSAEAWFGRAADRNTGAFTIQLGGGTTTNRPFEIVDYNWSNVQFSVDQLGVATAYTSMNAPIFKDSNNTGYYVDPNSASNLYGLAVQGGTGNNVSGYDATVYVSASNNNDWGIWIDKRTGNSDYGFQLHGSGSYAFYVVRSSDSVNTTRIDYSGYAYFATSINSPIFYDSNDGNYYVDPNSISRVAYVRSQSLGANYSGDASNWGSGVSLWGNYDTTTSWSGFKNSASIFGTHGNVTYGEYATYHVMDTTNRGWIWRYASSTTGGYNVFSIRNSDGFTSIGPSGYSGYRLAVQDTGYATGDWRAPIFKDSDNTGYYLDPAGATATSSYLNVGTFAGRWYYNNYLRSNNAGGLMGDYDINGTASKVIWTIGESWPIGNMYGIGYEYGSGYAHHLALRDNGTTYTRIGFAGGMYLSGIGYAGGSWRAPAFIDSDDGGYYIDPNSASDAALRIRGGALHGPNPTWGAYLYVGGNGRNDSWASVETTNGNLHLDCRNGGYAIYLNYYDGTTTRNRLMYWQDNDGYYMRQGSYSRMNEIGSDRTYGFTDLRTPILIDYNDGGYYVDPNGDSQFRYVYANNWFRPQGDCGVYWQTYGHGIWAPESEGGSYGNVSTYGGGRNGWQGYNVNASFTLMGRAGTDIGLYDQSWGWLFYVYYQTGQFMIGTSGTSGYRCYISGALYATDNIIAYSDVRVKKNIVTIDNALDKVMRLRGVYYEKIIKDPEKEINPNLVETERRIGVIAQEVQEVVPEFVTYDSARDEYGVKYPTISGLLIESTKELKHEMDQNKAQFTDIIEQLQKEIAGLRSELNRLKEGKE
jgi:hypothetical protein